MGGKGSTDFGGMFGGSDGNNMFKTMMLMNMFNGSNGGIGDMFDNMFDFGTDDNAIISSLMEEDKKEETEMKKAKEE